MAIPGFQDFMLPLLKLAADEKEHSIRDAIDSMAAVFNISDEEKQEWLPSGSARVLDNRVGWASTYLKKAGLLESPRRSYFRITPLGLKVLKTNPDCIDIKFLEQFPGFLEFRAGSTKDKNDGAISPQDSSQTPEEILEEKYQQIRDSLAMELLAKVKSCPPSFFEELVIDLLLKMGYGGSRKDAGQAIGKSGDGGIDGIIKEDRLGLDIIYVQAKRWEDAVGSQEIQKFVGALHGQGARKGVFITTSDFTKPAIEYANKIESKVVLINGRQLANLMIDFNVGVSDYKSFHIKKIDSDYFPDE